MRHTLTYEHTQEMSHNDASCDPSVNLLCSSHADANST